MYELSNNGSLMGITMISFKAFSEAPEIPYQLREKLILGF
jgi:hypothetical protein